jgi:hypothetical protein
MSPGVSGLCRSSRNMVYNQYLKVEHVIGSLHQPQEAVQKWDSEVELLHSSTTVFVDYSGGSLNLP